MGMIILYLMALFYIAAGVYHFVNPRLYLKIMPSYLPYQIPLIYISGLFEIIFGLLLIPETTRTVGGWLIIVLLLAVFPANIQMAINFKKKNNPNLWIAILRLPLQLVLMFLAWFYTHH